jgi:endonuclease I
MHAVQFSIQILVHKICRRKIQLDLHQLETCKLAGSTLRSNFKYSEKERKKQLHCMQIVIWANTGTRNREEERFQKKIVKLTPRLPTRFD